MVSRPVWVLRLHNLGPVVYVALMPDGRVIHLGLSTSVAVVGHVLLLLTWRVFRLASVFTLILHGEGRMLGCANKDLRIGAARFRFVCVSSGCQVWTARCSC